MGIVHRVASYTAFGDSGNSFSKYVLARETNHAAFDKDQCAIAIAIFIQNAGLWYAR